ncbi:MAG TPA: hypothetical protein VFJ09_08885 [Nocardioidaceae bacterium]|nr:hypothetical protein [Nocardioidaceae bacterium]
MTPALQVALVGADGAGKSTITQMLERGPVPFPVKRVYMGVNLESSSLMLPTTRLLLAVKRARGRRPDLVAGAHPVAVTAHARSQRLARTVKGSARLGAWVLEEWLRQLVAAGYGRRGYVVVFDRHFFADYYHSDIAPAPDRPAGARLHGWLLQHAYPKPDLVVCLDAPGDVLFRRKGEASAAWLEQRRQQYLGLGAVVPAFAVVDADRPVSSVFADVVAAIEARRKEAAS